MDVETDTLETPTPDHESEAPDSRIARLQKLSRGLCWVLIGLAALVLIGWVFGVEKLKRIQSDWVAMNPLTGVCFCLLGFALMRRAAEQSSRIQTRIAFGASVLVLGMALSRILGYATGVDIGLDGWLFRSALANDVAGPNRMAPNTAVSFCLSALAVMLLDVQTRRRGHRPSEYLAMLQGILALLALFGYAFGVHRFYGVAAYIPMAVHTAGMFLVLCAAILLARPDRGMMSIFISDSAGGVMARRLLPAIVLLPPMLGALRLMGEHRGLYETEFGVALHAVCMVGILTLLVCFTSSSLHNSERQRHEAALALRNQSRLLSSVLENLAEGVVAADERGNFTIWNRAAERILGRGASPLPIKDWSSHYEIFEADGKTVCPPERIPLVRAMNGECVNNVEVACRHPGSDELTALLASGHPLTGDNGEPSGGVVVFRDITERKHAEVKLRESEARYRTVVTTTIDGIITISDRGTIEFVNPALEQLFGYTSAELIGQNVNMLMPSPDHDKHDGYLENYRRTGKRHVVGNVREVMGRRKDGTTFPLQLAVGECDTGGRRLFIGAIQDITDRRRAQSALEEATRSAESANRAKSEFLATMSHELRTPLNGVIGMMDLLLSTELTPEQRRFAWLAKSSGDTLLSLISDILDFSKIEAGKLELESNDFDLRYAVENVAASFASRAEGKGLELVAAVHPDVPCLLRGDPGRLQQILLNLIGNAIKFTDRGEVSLRVTMSRNDSDTVGLRFVVRDTGPGIPADRLNRLFQSFSQVDSSSTRRAGGSGLGLAICMRLAELMGGEIGVDTELGKGSAFWFTASLRKGTSAHPNLRPIPAALRCVRALIVDDNATNREVLSEMLSAWHVDHDCAAHAEDAIGRMRAARREGRPFGLALVDMQMPDQDGCTLARRVKSDSDLREAVLVLLSSHAADMNDEWLKEQGFAGGLMKPIREPQLFALLMQLLSPTSAASAPAATERALQAEVHSVNSGHRASADARRLPVATTLEQRRILLAEDHEISQEVAETMLRMAGYQCEVVANGRLAVEAVRARPFAAVLMDCQMPEMDGFEATREIRRMERQGQTHAGAGGHIPIIALTANAIKGDRERCLASGMDDYLSKPLNMDRLIEVLEIHIAGRGASTGSQVAASPQERSTPAPKVPVDRARPAMPFDLELLRKKWGADMAFCRGLIAKYQRRLGADVDRIESHLRAGDAGAAAAAAHGLKGASDYVCARRVRAAAALIETACNENRLEDARVASAELRDAADACVAYRIDGAGEQGDAGSTKVEASAIADGEPGDANSDR